MSEFEFQQEPFQLKEKRPVFLLVLMILSGINIGAATLGALSGMLGAKPDKAMFKRAVRKSQRR
jgi:hypothetical protein